MRLHTDWFDLTDDAFKASCDDLGQAISFPLKIGFRNRLRGKTQPQPAPLPAQLAPPPPQYTVSTGSPHPSTGWWPFTQPSFSQPLVTPSHSPAGSKWADVSMSVAPRSTTHMQGPVAPPYDSCYGPPHSSELSGTSQVSPLSTRHVATTEPTAAAALARLAELKSESPASTAPKAAAADAPPGRATG
jgi:hypothetical protein